MSEGKRIIPIEPAGAPGRSAAFEYISTGKD